MVLRKKVVKKRMKRATGVTAVGRTRKPKTGGGQTKLGKRLSSLGPREKARAVARLRAKRKGR